ELAAGVTAEAGNRVLAFSNLFGVATGDEPSSVQHGIIAVKTRLDARRGTFETPYHGAVYVLDAMTNNPGAAGGALTNVHGELLRADSPAGLAGIKPDDLVVFVGDNLIHSCKGFREELSRIERDSKLRIVLMRDQELVEVEIPPVAEEKK